MLLSSLKLKEQNDGKIITKYTKHFTLNFKAKDIYLKRATFLKHLTEFSEWTNDLQEMLSYS